ncbi:MAG: hypothetical protein PQ964_02865 [Methanobacteriaceae archaeon]|jgi:hypothetical protein
MRPESLMSHKNKVIKRFNNIENDIYNDYPHKHNFKELKEIFSDLIPYTQNQKLKKCLEIILILISHKNKGIRAFALEKLFFLTNDELIQKLIIKELKNMLYDGEEDTREIADHSLDSISAEIYKIETIETFLDILYKISDTVEFNVIKFKDKQSSIVSQTGTESNLFNNFLHWFHTFNIRIDGMISYLVRLSCFLQRRLLSGIDGMISYLVEIKDEDSYFHLQNLESNKNDSLQRLASFYARTSMENGHIRRLIALLDDDDAKVQQIGANALIEAVENILINSDDKKLD